MKSALEKLFCTGPDYNRGRGIWRALEQLGLAEGHVWLVGGAARCWNRWGHFDDSVKDFDFLVDPNSWRTPDLAFLTSVGAVRGEVDQSSTQNRFGGFKLHAFDAAEAATHGRLVVDLWQAELAKYLSEVPLAGDGIALRVSDGFGVFTGEFFNRSRDFEIIGRHTVKHSDPEAWAAHKISVLKNN